MVYVDGILLIAPTTGKITEIKVFIASSFIPKDVGEARTFPGIRIIRRWKSFI